MDAKHVACQEQGRVGHTGRATGLMRAACLGLLLAGSVAEAADSPAPAIAPPAAVPAAGGDAARGAARSAEIYCDACHGPGGNSQVPDYPSIAGQGAAYMAAQLRLLRAGARPHPEMVPIAAMLSDADIVDLAAYYAGLPLNDRPEGGAAGGVGEKLYREGDAARAMPACATCHGPDGRGNVATGDPAVRAQQATYAARQFMGYAKRTRYKTDIAGVPAGGNFEIMQGIAEKLTPEEIQGVALYVQGMR